MNCQFSLCVFADSTPLHFEQTLSSLFSTITHPAEIYVVMNRFGRYFEELNSVCTRFETKLSGISQICQKSLSPISSIKHMGLLCTKDLMVKVNGHVRFLPGWQRWAVEMMKEQKRIVGMMDFSHYDTKDPRYEFKEDQGNYYRVDDFHDDVVLYHKMTWDSWGKVAQNPNWFVHLGDFQHYELCIPKEDFVIPLRLNRTREEMIEPKTKDISNIYIP